MHLHHRITLWALLTIPTICTAAEKEGASTSTKVTASPLSGGVLLETVGGLLVVVALIVALGWGIRRFGGFNLAGKGDVSILGGVSLGPRERAVLIKVGGTRLLVGVAPGRVQTLHVLADNETLNSEQPTVDFGKQLNNELDGASQ